MSDATTKDLRTLVEAVCTELRLGPFAAKTVERWVLTDPAAWPSCCLSGCDPCNDALRRAALEVLERWPSTER